MSSNGPRSLGCGGVLLAVLLLCIAAFVIPNLFNNDEVADSGDMNDTEGSILLEEDPTEPNVAQSSGFSDVEIGNLIVSTDIDRNGCPVDSVSMMGDPESFYVVAPNSDIPEGTVVFARLYYEGEPIEDVDEIVADRDYTDTCLNFVFETMNFAFDSGNYEVEFFVNGNVYGPVDFTVN